MFWSLILPLMLLVAFVTHFGVVNNSHQEENLAAVEQELDQYRAFLYAADQFFKKTPPPAALTYYSWADIKNSANPASQNIGINPFWKTVRMPDGTWSACTELSELAAASVGRIFEGSLDEGPSQHVVDVGPGRKAIGIGTVESAQGAANLCKGA